MVKISEILGKNSLMRHPLEVKMTLWVATAVIVVTAVFIGIASNLYYNRYKNELNQGITADVNNTTKSLSLAMGYFENEMHTAVVYARYDAMEVENLDSILIETLRGFNNVDAVSILYPQGYYAEHKDSITLHVAYREDNGDLTLGLYSYNPVDDENWQMSYVKGKYHWSSPFPSLSHRGWTMIALSAPLLDEHDRPYAILCASLKIDMIIPSVVNNKTNRDIDVSIYADDGQCIVPKADNIEAMDVDDLIIEHRKLEDLGWTMVFCTPKDVINSKVNKVIITIIILAALLLVTVMIAIVLCVNYVARPFIRTQQALSDSKAAMQREMDIAAQAQHNIVPHKFPAFPNRDDIALYAMLEPALYVGGDLYDYYIHDEKLHFCIGDVSGKGSQASLFMSATRYLFRSMTGASVTLAQAVANINRSLCTDNAGCNFVTFFYGCLDLQTGNLEYCNAGHNLPIIYSARQGTATFLKNTDDGMPLGVYEEAEYEDVSVRMDDGDMIFLYTDGVTEAMNKDQQELGDAATLACISDNADKDPETIIKAMRQCISQHAGEYIQSDDITMLCISRSNYETNKNQQ